MSSNKKPRHVTRENDIENSEIIIPVIKKYFKKHPSIS